MKTFKKYSITEQDVQNMFKEVLFDIRNLSNKGIHVPVPYDNISLKKTYLHGCHTLGRHTYYYNVDKCEITINDAFFTGYMSKKTLRSILIHEVIHSLPHCQNHGPNFQKWAGILGKEFGLIIGTHCTVDEDFEFKRACFAQAKSIAVCVDCNNYFLYPVMSAGIKHWRFKHEANYLCCCQGKNKIKKQLNLLIIKYNEHFLQSNDYWCNASVRPRAKEWLKKHVPPEYLSSGKTFIWTPEAIEQEFWWKNKNDAVEVAAMTSSPDELCCNNTIKRKRFSHNLKNNHIGAVQMTLF